MKAREKIEHKETKEKSFYFPFLLISVIFIGGYSFLNWFFVIRNQSHLISADLSNYWLPFSLPIIPVFIFFYVKLKHIELDVSQIILISLISSMLIAPAAIVAQSLLNRATGSMLNLENVNQIPEYPTSRYYKLKQFDINKRFAGFYGMEKSASRTSYDYEIFIACPVLVNKADTLKSKYNVWVIKRYYKNFIVFDNPSIEEREDAFWKDSMKDFEKLNLNDLSYFKTVEYDDNFTNFRMAVNNSEKASKLNNNVLIETVNQKFEDRNGDLFIWFLALFIFGQLIFIFLQPFFIKICNN